MIFPVPLQLLQTDIFTNWPNIDLETSLTSPEPLQTEQVLNPELLFAPVPLQEEHLSYFFIFIVFEVPEAISSIVSFMVTFKYEPGVPVCCCLVLPPAPPLKRSSKIDDPPKPPPNISEK